MICKKEEREKEKEEGRDRSRETRSTAPPLFFPFFPFPPSRPISDAPHVYSFFVCNVKYESTGIIPPTHPHPHPRMQTKKKTLPPAARKPRKRKANPRKGPQKKRATKESLDQEETTATPASVIPDNCWRHLRTHGCFLEGEKEQKPVGGTDPLQPLDALKRQNAQLQSQCASLTVSETSLQQKVKLLQDKLKLLQETYACVSFHPGPLSLKQHVWLRQRQLVELFQPILASKPTLISHLHFIEVMYCIIEDGTRCAHSFYSSTPASQTPTPTHALCDFQPYAPIYQRMLHEQLISTTHSRTFVGTALLTLHTHRYQVSFDCMIQMNLQTWRIRNLSLRNMTIPTNHFSYPVTCNVIDAIRAIQTPEHVITHVVDVRSSTLTLRFLRNLERCTNVLPVWHGSRHGSWGSLLQHGFQLAASRMGAQGQGVYGSTSWKYAQAYGRPPSDRCTCAPLDVKAGAIQCETQICSSGCSGLWFCLAAFNYLAPSDCTQSFVDTPDGRRLIMEGSWASIPDGINIVIRMPESGLCPLFWVGFRKRTLEEEEEKKGNPIT